MPASQTLVKVNGFLTLFFPVLQQSSYRDSTYFISSHFYYILVFDKIVLKLRLLNINWGGQCDPNTKVSQTYTAVPKHTYVLTLCMHITLHEK